MPEWIADALKIVATALTTGGGLAVWFTYRLKRIKAEADRRASDAAIDNTQRSTDAAIIRQARADEITVLHGQLDRLEKELAAAKEESRSERHKLWAEVTEIRAARDKEVSDLKSLLSAALIENGRLTVQEKHLMDRNKELQKHNRQLEERVDKLEAEVNRLREAADRGEEIKGSHPAG